MSRTDTPRTASDRRQRRARWGAPGRWPWCPRPARRARPRAASAADTSSAMPAAEVPLRC